MQGGADSVLNFSSGSNYYPGLEAVYKYSISYSGQPTYCNYNIIKTDLSTNKVLYNKTLGNYIAYSDDIMYTNYTGAVYYFKITTENFSAILNGNFCISQSNIKVWHWSEQWNGDIIIFKGGNFTNDNLSNELFGITI